MISLDDVRKYLNDNKVEGDWDDDTVSAVLAAERSHQRSVLNIPSPRPDAVDRALLLRVAHNLATTNGEPLVRVGVQGDGVRDLEAPYDRVSPTQPDEGSTNRGRPRSAKKTAATKAATTQEGTS